MWDVYLLAAISYLRASCRSVLHIAYSFAVAYIKLNLERKFTELENAPPRINQPVVTNMTKGIRVGAETYRWSGCILYWINIFCCIRGFLKLELPFPIS